MNKQGAISLMGIIVIAVIIAAGLAAWWMFSSGKGKGFGINKEDAAVELALAEAKKLKDEGKAEGAIAALAKVTTAYPEAKNLAAAYAMLAELYEQANRPVEAKNTYKKVITDYPDYPDIAAAQKKIWDLNIKILFSPVKTDDAVIYEVKSGDSLYKIAQKFNTTVEMLMRGNNITTSQIRPKQQLKISNLKFNILVDKSLNTLTLKTGDEIFKIYNVSTGENNSTPIGAFKITNKLVDPPWFKTGAVIPPGSPENILGTRWMGIDRPGYGIHGTTLPESIGKQSTAGCVRMLNSEVEELYAIVPVGTEVAIQD